MKKTGSKWLLIGAALMALTGCATRQAPQPDHSALRSANPRSILVVMPTNHSPDVKAGEGVLSQMTVPLAERGYYVFPVAVVDEMFRQNGLTNGHEIRSAPLKKLRDIFGADAVLYMDVKDYGSSYQIIGSETRVSLDAKLVDVRTGQQLWEGSASSSTSSGSGGAGLVGMLISAAASQILDTITDRGYEVAGIAAMKLIHQGSQGPLLVGPYHPSRQAAP